MGLVHMDDTAYPRRMDNTNEIRRPISNSPAGKSFREVLAARDKVKQLLIEFESRRTKYAPSGETIATRGDANEIRCAAVDLHMSTKALLNSLESWSMQQNPKLPPV